MRSNRYALITVDTEAQPRRASGEHVKRLIWGEHESGTAGIREMCAVADEVAAKLVYFVDACGVYSLGNDYAEAVRWLVSLGHDVQLHTHSEFLPDSFWNSNGFSTRPRLLNEYDEDRAYFTIRYFSEYLAGITGKPVNAFRGGSFRWNAGTLRALGELGIPLSFNNSMWAYGKGACPHAETTVHPFVWSNGVIEVPLTERRFPILGQGNEWGMLTFPASQSGASPPWRALWPFTIGRNISVLVVLVHSWSFLYWDKNGYAEYRGDQRIEEFRNLMHRLAKDYDIITTREFLDLHACGKIVTHRQVDMSILRYGSPTVGAR
jgi:hypothetical protein